MVFGGDWVKDLVREASGPLNKAVDKSLKDAERSVRTIVDDTLPKVRQLVGETVEDVDTRAQRIVDASLRQTYRYVDEALVNVEGRLSSQIARAGAEFRQGSGHAVKELEDAVGRTIERLERNSVARLEQSVQSSIEGAARTTRLELQLLIASVGRVLLGIFLPLPALVFAWRSHGSGAWPTPAAVGIALGLLAASAVAVAMVSTGSLVRRAVDVEDRRLGLREALVGYLPFVTMGAVLGLAIFLSR